ncbi:hypothetical protein CPB97_001571 [Podila verticillata]|nr:hypothetical protein CPB97_001571 [Podila verticillata]
MISNSSASNNTLVPDNDAATTTATTDDLLKAKAAAALSQNRKSDIDMEIESLEQQPTPPPPNPSSSSPGTPLASSGPSHHAGAASEPAPPSSSSTKEDSSIVPQKHQSESKPAFALTAQWNGKKLPFEIDMESTIGELKNMLMELTNVEPKRQKLMLVKGKLPEDHVVLSTLSLKNNQTFLMMGTPEAKVIKAPEVMPDVLNDLEEDYTPDDEAFANDAQNQKSLKSTVAKCDINIMNPLRPGKKLLVLDLDYTLIDCKALNSHMFDIMRPGLHDFLTVCYEHYDIVIWSQTSWRALEAKITTIGLLDHINYKIAFVMDISTMFSVLSQRDGKPFKHQVKALDIIWQKFPQFSARNTIHVDDLSRNFAMNPKSGLKIGAYKNGAVSRHTDKELVHLAKYLVEITKSSDFKELDHKNWKSHRKLTR